jgi:hypothetical protein
MPGFGPGFGYSATRRRLLGALLPPSNPIIAARRAQPVTSYPADPVMARTYVTNLNDSGTGSLRSAVTVGGPNRIIDFSQLPSGGTINALTDLNISHRNLIIAGETAPAPGITIMSNYICSRVISDSVTIRHVRLFTRGGSPPGYGDRDSGQIGTGVGGTAGDINSIVFLNCTLAWAADEILSSFPNSFYPDRYFYDHSIIQCCLLEPVNLQPSGLGDNHPFPLLFGSPGIAIFSRQGSATLPCLPVKRCLAYRNVFHRGRDRMPRFGHGTTGWSVNNIISAPGRNGRLDLGYDPTLNIFATVPDAIAVYPASSTTANVTISGTSLTLVSGTLSESTVIKGAGIAANTVVTAKLTATTFTVSVSQNVTNLPVTAWSPKPIIIRNGAGYDIVFNVDNVAGNTMPYASYPSNGTFNLDDLLATKVSIIGNIGWKGNNTEPFNTLFSQGLPAGTKVYMPDGSNYMDDVAMNVTAPDLAVISFDPRIGALHEALPVGVTVAPTATQAQRDALTLDIVTVAGACPWFEDYTTDRCLLDVYAKNGQNPVAPANQNDWPPLGPILLTPLVWASGGSISEIAESGAVVGVIGGTSTNSIDVSLSDNAGGLFFYDAPTKEVRLVATGSLDFETATSHPISVQQSFVGASNTPLVTPLTVTVTDDPEIVAKTIPQLIALLGTKLRRLWVANNNASIIHSGPNCTAWVDVIAGQSLPVIGTPQYKSVGAAIINPVVAFNGTTDAFRSAGAALNASYPSGTAGGWLWALFDQQGTGATTRTMFGYGGTGTQGGRLIEKVQTTAVQRLRIGRGSGGLTDNSGSSFQGAHAVGGRFENGGVNISGSFDDLNVPSGAFAFSTTSASGTRTAIGCDLQSTAGQFALGELGLCMVTDETLDANDIAEIRRTLRAYRLGTI